MGFVGGGCGGGGGGGSPSPFFLSAVVSAGRRSTLSFCCFQYLNCCWWRFNYKVERLILINGDNNWKSFPSFILCTTIELLTEFHDVHTGSTQSRPNWW